MFRLRILSAALICSISCGDGAEVADPVALAPSSQEAALIAGKPAQSQEFAETGALIRENFGLCSGTLIAPRVVLTAAHCVPASDHAMVFVPRAKAFPLALGATYRIIEAIPHPLYASRQHDGLPLYARLRDPQSLLEYETAWFARARCGAGPSTLGEVDAWADCLHTLSEELRINLGLFDPDDIALLVLDRPVDDVPLARLPPAAPPLETPRRATAVGYGFREASLWRLPLGQRYVGGLMLQQAGVSSLVMEPDAAMIRPGDSGGPLYLDDGSSREVVGVAQNIRLAGPKHSYGSVGLYTRVDSHLPWLQSILRQVGSGMHARRK